MGHHGMTRDKFPWFPKIDYELCLKDLDCLNFCQHEVFEWDPVGRKPIVAHPYGCLPGCSSCADHCKMNAITLPTGEEIRCALRRLRRQHVPIGGT